MECCYATHLKVHKLQLLILLFGDKGTVQEKKKQKKSKSTRGTKVRKKRLEFTSLHRW